MSKIFQIVKVLLVANLSFFSIQLNATEFTVHSATNVGEYMITVGSTLDNSTGLMVELAAAAFRNAKIQVKMAPDVPWARAQINGIDDPGGIVVSLGRTPLREEKWNWLTPMYGDKVYAYTMNDSTSWSSYDEIAKNKPNVGAKLGSFSDSMLTGLGVKVEATPDMSASFKKLLLGRISVFLLQGMEVVPALQPLFTDLQFKDKIPQLRRTVIYELQLWMVCSRKVPEADAQKLREALENFKKTDEYKDIIKKYEDKLNAFEVR